MTTPTNWELNDKLHKQHYFTGPSLSEVTATISVWADVNGVGLDEADDGIFATDVSISYAPEFGWTATVTYFHDVQLGRV